MKDSKFKVGMKVRIKGDEDDDTTHLDGKIGTIIEMRTREHYDDDCRVSVDGEIRWIWNSNMTPVNEYKVGDHIIIDGSNVEELEVFKGKTGVIMRVMKNTPYSYKVHPDHWTSNCGIWCKVSDYAPEIPNEPKNIYDITTLTNGKVKCVGYKKHEHYFTLNKVYDVINNNLVADNGFKYHPINGRNTVDWLGEYYDFEVVVDYGNPVIVDGFKVGDRVTYKGNLGTIVCIDVDKSLGVEFDERGIGFHNCTCRKLIAGEQPTSKKCLYVNSKQLKHITDESITITHDGKTTTATLTVNGETITATARCSPEDEFDFMVGAKLAMERLEKKLYPAEILTPACEWKVVNREPKAGDYIRLIRDNFSFNEIGDILKVHRVINSNTAVVLNGDHPRGGSSYKYHNYEWYYCKEEYEVVEKVTPNVTPPAYLQARNYFR